MNLAQGARSDPGNKRARYFGAFWIGPSRKVRFVRAMGWRTLLLPWFVIALLIGVNALYVAAEFSAVAVRRSTLTQLARAGSTRAESLLELLERGPLLDRYIAACQIGITLSSLVVGAYGQATIGRDLARLLEQGAGLERSQAQPTAALAVLLGFTVLQVLLGELVPKSIALQYPERTALFTYLPTRWSMKLYRPFIWLLNGSALLMLKPFGVQPGDHQHVHSPEEIDLLLVESRRQGRLEPGAQRRLRRGLHLAKRTVRQLMVPRSQIVAVEIATPIPALLDLLQNCPFSRLPVYRGSLDEILGAVDLKTVVGRLADEGSLPPLADIVRPIPFVPEMLTADRLVHFLQDNHASKAIVVDEFGVVQGIVSVEDILAELFGSVSDELKEQEPHLATRLPDGSALLPGSIPLVEAERFLGVTLDGHAATLGGYVIDGLGRFPKEGDRFVVQGLELVVKKMDRTAIAWLEARAVKRSAPLSLEDK